MASEARRVCGCLLIALSFMGCQESDPAAQFRNVVPGLQVLDLRPGDGPEIIAGDFVQVHYSGWLWVDDVKGELFDTSLESGKPIMLKVDAGMVIKGWDDGLKGMRVGGKRSLLIAPELAYGAGGRPPVIPPNSTLLFDIEVVALPAIEMEVLSTGEGMAAEAGDRVQVHYTGWIATDGAKGVQFDSSHDRGQPYAFPLGASQVIPGWDMGIEGMQVGEQRRLTIPPELAYGDRGVQQQSKVVIPPQATLIFEVELVKIVATE